MHRTTNPNHSQQPLVYPSSFNTADRPSVKPIESLPGFAQSSINGGAFPYGPRSLKLDFAPNVQVQKRRKRSVDVLSRNVRSAELGVTSAYEVVSEVDLDFVPNAEEERNRAAIFRVRTFSRYHTSIRNVFIIIITNV